MLTHTATSAVADTTMSTNMNTLTHTAMSAVADTTMVMSTNTLTLTHTATNAVADTTTSTNMLTHMVTNAVADTTTATNTNMLTNMVTNAAADMTMDTNMNMLMHTDITFPVILLTVIAKSAIRMRNTAMYAARAWLIAPAVCRMPIKLSVYIFCKTLAVPTALPKWNIKSKSCRV